MSVKHQESAKRRWATTTVEERARLGGLHSEALKAYWATITPEERSRRAAHAANTRHGKIRSSNQRTD